MMCREGSRLTSNCCNTQQSKIPTRNGTRCLFVQSFSLEDLSNKYKGGQSWMSIIYKFRFEIKDGCTNSPVANQSFELLYQNNISRHIIIQNELKTQSYVCSYCIFAPLRWHATPRMSYPVVLHSHVLAHWSSSDICSEQQESVQGPRPRVR